MAPSEEDEPSGISQSLAVRASACPGGQGRPRRHCLSRAGRRAAAPAGLRGRVAGPAVRDRNVPVPAPPRPWAPDRARGRDARRAPGTHPGAGTTPAAHVSRAFARRPATGCRPACSGFLAQVHDGYTGGTSARGLGREGRAALAVTFCAALGPTPTRHYCPRLRLLRDWARPVARIARSVLARTRRYGPAAPGTHVTLAREVVVQLRTSYDWCDLKWQ